MRKWPRQSSWKISSTIVFGCWSCYWLTCFYFKVSFHFSILKNMVYLTKFAKIWKNSVKPQLRRVHDKFLNEEINFTSNQPFSKHNLLSRIQASAKKKLRLKKGPCHIVLVTLTMHVAWTAIIVGLLTQISIKLSNLACF